MDSLYFSVGIKSCKVRSLILSMAVFYSTSCTVMLRPVKEIYMYSPQKDIVAVSQPVTISYDREVLAGNINDVLEKKIGDLVFNRPIKYMDFVVSFSKGGKLTTQIDVYNKGEFDIKNEIPIRIDYRIKLGLFEKTGFQKGLLSFNTYSKILKEDTVNDFKTIVYLVKIEANRKIGPYDLSNIDRLSKDKRFAEEIALATTSALSRSIMLNETLSELVHFYLPIKASGFRSSKIDYSFLGLSDGLTDINFDLILNYMIGSRELSNNNEMETSEELNYGGHSFIPVISQIPVDTFVSQINKKLKAGLFNARRQNVKFINSKLIFQNSVEGLEVMMKAGKLEGVVTFLGKLIIDGNEKIAFDSLTIHPESRAEIAAKANWIDVQALEEYLENLVRVDVKRLDIEKQISFGDIPKDAMLEWIPLNDKRAPTNVDFLRDDGTSNLIVQRPLKLIVRGR